MKTARDIINQWMQAVNEKDADTLAALYDSQAVLIPTFSNRILNTPEKVREYFEKLASRDGLNIALHENTVAEQVLHAQIHVISGLYKWRFAIEGEMLSFEARFNYVMDLAKPSPIMHHHSSQIPRML